MKPTQVNNTKRMVQTKERKILVVNLVFIGYTCLTLANLAVQGKAEAQARCSFNGNWEGCKVIGQKETQSPFTTSRTIRWISDGKIVTYKFSSCKEVRPNAGAWYCKATITEDNGRITYGNALMGGGLAKVTSQRGNTTTIPMFNQGGSGQ